MNIFSKNTFSKAGIVLAISTASLFANADAKQDITNARQETQIWTTYALSPYLRAHELKVNVQDGKAVLTGTVDEEVNKDLAKEIALGVSGIKSVDNQIVVKSDAAAKNTTGYGEVVDDATITAAVKSRLLWSKFSYISTKVETKGGRVTLTGTVDNADSKAAATKLAGSTRGVIAVSNQLNVENKSHSSAKAGTSDKADATDKAKKAANEAGANVADAWITTKVKSNFFYSNNVSGSDIDVSTSAGIVTLKGKVGSGAERALAIELTENIRGVKSVNAKELMF